MKSENLVPKVRFKGLSDPWEQRKLKNIATRVRGNDGRMELPTLTISATQGWLNQKDRFSENIAGKEQKNYTLLKKGQLSYNHGNSKTAKYGAVFKLNIYTEALVPRVYHSFAVKHNNSADFIEYLFATGDPNRELRKLVSSGARMDGLLNINFDAFFNINLQVPIATEQMRIAQVFRKTDSLIAANEDKLEQLKTLKKLMMQKIFSQEWRFKGFTDPWEQRKLLEIADRLSKSSNSENLAHVEYADIISGEGRLKSESLIQKRTDSRSGIQFVAQNVLYGKLRPYLNNWLFPNFPGIAVGDFWVFQAKKGIFAPFLYALIQSPKYQQVANISTGTKMPRSDWKKVSGIHFEVPIEFNEQRKIGHLFLRLDSLIAANEDKLNQLKELKKYLMQNMFV